MTRADKSCRKPLLWLVPGLAALSLTAACGPGSGQGLDENGNPLSLTDGVDQTIDDGNQGGGASGNPNATLAWVQANVFGGVCTQCHTGAGAPLGVDWSSESATCDNVGRPSGEKFGMVEIDSGDPAASYLIWKLEGEGPNQEPIVLEPMPLNNPPLAPETIQNIKDWIADGTPGCSPPTAAIDVHAPAATPGRGAGA